MDRIDVVVPTRNRLEKLKRLLRTIPRYDWMRVVVVCDGDLETYYNIITGGVDLKQIWPIYLPEHLGSVKARNFVIPCLEDGVLYACDDIEFGGGAIEEAKNTFNQKFPDDDGVIGFNQGKRDHNESGVGLIGKKFLDRYQGRMPFYPGYYHFAAQEIGQLAKKVGKFHYAPHPSPISLWHHHPVFEQNEMDQTHADARANHAIDRKIKEKRREHNLIWGDRK